MADTPTAPGGSQVEVDSLRRRIAELERAEAALRENERFLQSIFDGIGDGLSVLDVDLNVLRVNQWMERMYACEMPLVGRKCYEAFRRRQSACPQCPTVRACDTGVPHTEVVPYFSGDRLLGWMELSSFPLKDAQGRITGIIEHVKDITQRRRTEEALQESKEADRRFAQRLTSLQEVNNELTRSGSVDELCRLAVELGRSRFGFDRLGIWLVDRDKDRVTGTFGTDEYGRTCDERAQSRPLDATTRAIIERNQQVGVTREERASLRDGHGRTVAQGVHAWTSIWDGHRNIGFLDADNLLGGQPITGRDCELLALYASALGHLYVRQRSEEALRSAEQRLRQVVESLPIILYSVEGGTNRMQLVLGPVKEMIGYSPEYLTSAGDIGGRFVHPEDKAYVASTFRHGLTVHQPFELEYRVVHGQDGRSVWVREYVAPVVGPDGQIIRQDGVVVDVTEQKNAEAEHERIRSELLQAQKLQSIGVLAGGIAHDFSNLLTVISGNAQILRRKLSSDAEHAAILKDIEAAATHATEMTRSLQAFTRPTRPRIRHGDANTLVKEAYRLLRRVIPATIDFRLDLAAAPCVVGVDPGQMQQVLVNLCVNARDAMPHGGTLTIQTRQVGRGELPARVRAHAAHERYLRLRVEDTGCGMDPDTLVRIFDPFFTTKPMDRGTGLGLAIVYRIVDAHDGAIDVKSQPDRGATFDLFFPAVEGEPEPEAHQEIPSARGKERILVVEDEEMVGTLLRTVLEGRGYQVVLTSRAEEALAVAAGSPPDLVIIDYALPGATGDRLLAEMRQSSPQLKAILMTGHDIDETEIAASRCRLLYKPFAVTTIAQLVREAIDGADVPPGADEQTP